MHAQNGCLKCGELQSQRVANGHRVVYGWSQPTKFYLLTSATRNRKASNSVEQVVPELLPKQSTSNG